MRRLSPLALCLLLTACAHSTIIPFAPAGGAPAPAYAPVPPQNVGIYRSTRPFDPFTELGLITFQTGSFDLPVIYNQLRQDAGARGAEAVIDVKFHSESHTELQYQQVCKPQTTCDAQGICSSTQDCEMVTVPQEVTTFTIEGSLIRRKM